MNLSAIFSKTGKGVQEASGKTSNLSRGDRTVLAAIDGKTPLSEVQKKFDKLTGPKFEALIQQLDKDGFVREVSSGAASPAAPVSRTAAPPPKAPAAASGEDEALDFTQAIKLPPKASAPAAAPKPPPLDLAAASRAEAERKAKEQQAFDYKVRQDSELKAKAEAKARAESEAKARAEAEARARAAAEAQARADAQAKSRAEAEGKARSEADARALAEAEAKVKSAREAAVRMATEVKAKAEAEGKARTDAAEEREREALEKARKESEDKARLEADLTAKLEHERRAREDAERRAREAADQARKDLAEKATRDAEELRQRLEAEMKAKLEEERKAREAEDRKRREEEDRKRAEADRKRAEEDRQRREEDDRRRKEEEERRAKEEAERKAREAEDRQRREEEDRQRREDDERRRKEDEERRAKEAAERSARKEEEQRRAKEEAERRKEDEERRVKEEAQRRAKEDAERRARDEQDSKRRKEEEDRRAKEEAERRKREESERRSRDEVERKANEEAEAKARAAQSASTSLPSIQSTAVPPPPPAAAGGIDDSLLADLDSFGQREEEEQKAKEEAERKAKEAAARKAKEETERLAKVEAERRAKEIAENKRREEAERKAKEAAEQRAREDEEREKEEEAERKRKAKEALAAKEAERKAAQRATAAKRVGKDDDDIGVTDDDLDLDEVKKDEKALSATARNAAREQAPLAAAAVRRPKKWGKPAAIALFVLLVAGVGVLHVMPVSTAEYEKAASEAMGVPVKIASARLSVITGIEIRFEGVTIGDTVKIRSVQGYPEVGSLFGVKKSFSRIELEGVSLSQSQLADAVLGKVSGENFRVGRVVIRQAKFDGPLALPALDVDATVSGDGSLQVVSLRGGDKLSVQLSPKGNDIGFEISAASLAVPFAPALNLSDFGMKGTANRGGVTMSEFDGRAFDGVISGSAKIRWGANWLADGEVRVRGVRVAVLAPALVSEGKVDGRGAYAMSGPNPATLFESARIQGEFKIEKGVLGSFDLTRALQSGGTQSGGRTIFSELTGQAVYDKGAVKITNVSIAAGAMNAGASLDVDVNGGLSGRIVADVKTPNQTLRATLNVSGKIQEPVIRK